MMVLSNNIIQRLISRDEKVTQQFFFNNCRPLFHAVIKHVFDYEVDYDEFVNELYIHIMENDAYRLRQFQGRSSIYQWLKIVAIRFFMEKRNRMIEDKSKETPIDVYNKFSNNTENMMSSRIDISNLLSMLDNKRYAFVIERLVIDDAEPKTVAKELSVTVDNLYNIKKRAIAAMTQIVINEIEKYEKEIIR